MNLKVAKRVSDSLPEVGNASRSQDREPTEENVNCQNPHAGDSTIHPRNCWHQSTESLQLRHPTCRNPFSHEDVSVSVEASIVWMDKLALNPVLAVIPYRFL